LAEIREHRKKISKFRKEQSKLQEFLFQRIGLIARAYVTKIIQHLVCLSKKSIILSLVMFVSLQNVNYM